jgi:hypothetical protein
MALVVKTVKGKKYLYEQKSYRSGGKVKSISSYIGPMLALPFWIMGGFLSGGGGGFSAPSGKGRSRSARSNNGHRERQIWQNTQRALDVKFGVDKSSLKAYRGSYGAMPEHLRSDYHRETIAALREHRAQHTPPAKPDAEKQRQIQEFNAARQAEKAATLSAPAPSADAPSLQDGQSSSDAPSTDDAF